MSQFEPASDVASETNEESSFVTCWQHTISIRPQLYGMIQKRLRVEAHGFTKAQIVLNWREKNNRFDEHYESPKVWSFTSNFTNTKKRPGM